MNDSRKSNAATAAVAMLMWLAAWKVVGGQLPGVANAADLDTVAQDKVRFVNRLLNVIEQEIVPLTQQGVRQGNKVFGAAILRKSDLSTVVAATNSETGNPLLHGEITAINKFYAIPPAERPAANECVFVCTHEPCPLCLSGITWGGFDNFFYLFSYEDTKDAFSIPHDLRIQQQVFGVTDGNYAQKNDYWSSWGIQQIVASCDRSDRERLGDRVWTLREIYKEMSAIYQQSKAERVDIPLK